MAMKTKKWIAGVAAAVLMSGMIAVPQAMAGLVGISNFSSQTVKVITYAGTAHHSMEFAANTSGPESTYGTSGITRIVVKLKTSSNNWEDKADYYAPHVSVSKNYFVVVDQNGIVKVSEEMLIQ